MIEQMELKMKNTKYILLLIAIIIEAATMVHGQSSFKKPLLNSTLIKYPNALPINIGIKGSIVENNMAYSALNTSKNHLLFSIDGGISIEWNFSQNISAGLDIMYSSRGTKKSFKTEFLLDFSTSDFAYYDYSAKLKGIEFFLPISVFKDVYFPEDITYMRNSSSKVYIFAGPELYVPISGNMDWKRYYSDGTVYCEYHVDASKSTIRDFYYGFGFGIGFWHKKHFSLGNKNTFSISKIDFSCFLESNTLSEQEMEESVENVYAWGDLEHEELGKRYGIVFKVSGTILLPIKYKPTDSCHGIGVKSKTHKK